MAHEDNYLVNSNDVFRFAGVGAGSNLLSAIEILDTRLSMQNLRGLIAELLNINSRGGGGP